MFFLLVILQRQQVVATLAWSLARIHLCVGCVRRWDALVRCRGQAFEKKLVSPVGISARPRVHKTKARNRKTRTGDLKGNISWRTVT